MKVEELGVDGVYVSECERDELLIPLVWTESTVGVPEEDDLF